MSEPSVPSQEPPCHLSIILPMYNEEARVGSSLEKVLAYLKDQPYGWEVLAVDDGSTDRTRDIVEAFIARNDNGRIRLLAERHRGKGHAIQAGVEKARGAFLLFSDTDLSTPIQEVERFLPLIRTEYDIVIGSRESIGAQRHNEPLSRHVVGRLYNGLVRSLTVKGFHDTQCGFKIFRREPARFLFRQLTIDRFSFDVEILFLAQKHGFRIGELPVPWYYEAHSKMRVLRDGFRMGLDVLRIRWNELLGRYG